MFVLLQVWIFFSVLAIQLVWSPLADVLQSLAADFNSINLDWKSDRCCLMFCFSVSVSVSAPHWVFFAVYNLLFRTGVFFASPAFNSFQTF